ncbi:MAG: ATP-binding cassette domain-containing protein [Phycisphaerae bacterium]|nr:ATP-binding cassette domain-containing protein [Phycisphaerae bacterium]
MTVTAIDISDVSFSYDGLPVLENVNLRIEAGDFVCVVGPNGGGKTTLLKLMLGLLQPGEGKVSVLGQPPHQACRQVGYMPQYSLHDLRFPVNVLDVVLMGRLRPGLRFGRYSQADRQAAMDALDAVEIADMHNQPLAALSGGQRQRVMIARALAAEPKLLMLDEPTNNLDIRIGEELYELLGELNRRMTVVVVSHDVGFAPGRVKTIVCVNRFVKVHPTAELTAELLREVYGGDIRLVQHSHDCIERGCEGGRHK